MKRHFAAIFVCMAVLLASFTGCYSPQENAPSVPTAPTQAAQTESGSSAEEPVEIKTYPLPEENVGRPHICSVSLDRRLLDVRGVQRKLDPGV